jgi:hypothetical protein
LLFSIGIVFLTFLSVPLFISRASAETSLTTTTTLEGRLEFPDKTPFNITNTRISLNNEEYHTYSRMDGSFVIYDVPPGIHQLDIHSTNYHFAQVKIQLLEDSMEQPKCLEYAYPGSTKQVTKYPLVLYPYATYQYFEAKKGFNLFSMLKNPMVLMMLFSVVLMVAMPRMMEGLDPEEKAKMREQMQAQQDPTKMMSEMWGQITGTQEEEKAPTRRERIKDKKSK